MEFSNLLVVAQKQGSPKTRQDAHLAEVYHHVPPDVYAFSGYPRQDVLLAAVFSCRLSSFVIGSGRVDSLSASIMLGG